MCVSGSGSHRPAATDRQSPTKGYASPSDLMQHCPIVPPCLLAFLFTAGDVEKALKPRAYLHTRDKTAGEQWW